MWKRALECVLMGVGVFKCTKDGVCEWGEVCANVHGGERKVCLCMGEGKCRSGGGYRCVDGFVVGKKCV